MNIKKTYWKLTVGIAVLLFIVGTFSSSITANNRFRSFERNILIKNDSDLECWGELNWTEVEPGTIVYGQIYVRNAGKVGTLFWEISEWPDWGIWDFGTFFPKIPPGGYWIVFLNLTAPDQENSSFFGHIMVNKKFDESDYEIINASILTGEIKSIDLKTEMWQTNGIWHLKNYFCSLHNSPRYRLFL